MSALAPRPPSRARLATPARPALPALLALLALLQAPAPLARAAEPAASAAAEPWALLAEARQALERASPLLADFEQTFVPAGFSAGESERGRLAIGLPRCLRWDYEEPFPKSYLLCGRSAWAWNPGEATGRLHLLEPDEERGLELLRLGVDELRATYRAALGPATEKTAEIRLVPLAEGGQVRDATLVIDRAARRPVRLAYHDAEGNYTRFELAGYRPLEDATLFLPPAALEWLQD